MKQPSRGSLKARLPSINPSQASSIQEPPVLPRGPTKAASTGSCSNHSRTISCRDGESWGVSLESFEKVVRSQTEQSGFMLFAKFDYHQWLGLYGIQRKLARWILGNPVVAITMIRHDLEAALRAPVELLLVEDENREGVTVIYDLPSSLIVTRENPPLLEAAAALDAKLQDLVTEVTSGA